MKLFAEPAEFQDVDVKIQSKKKIKRLGLAPASFQGLRVKIETMIAEERSVVGN